jgi:hypothetical protein
MQFCFTPQYLDVQRNAVPLCKIKQRNSVPLNTKIGALPTSGNTPTKATTKQEL